MECPQPILPIDNHLFRRLNPGINQRRVPFYGSLELTRRCGLDCIHCYLKGSHSDVRDSRPELTLLQWKKIIDDIAAAGCMFLTLTGGDPLMRNDFIDLYTYAKHKGLLITVFTVGSSLTPPILELFSELPPYAVEITIYGSSAKTHDMITSVKGSYAGCIGGIEALTQRHINLRLKTIAMKFNLHEIPTIKKMAEAYGAHFRFDPDIFPRFNGDQKPTEFRAPPEQVIKLQFEDTQKQRQWSDFYLKTKEIRVTDKLYICGAGIIVFHIDAFGYLQPCLMVNSLKYDLIQGNFDYGWENVIPQIHLLKSDPTAQCQNCKIRLICSCCPGFFELENGNGNMRSDYICRSARLRHEAILSHIRN